MVIVFLQFPGTGKRAEVILEEGNVFDCYRLDLVCLVGFFVSSPA